MPLRVREIGLRDRVRRELCRSREGLFPQRRLVAVSDIDELVFQPLVERVEDRRRSGGFARHVQDEIGPHRWTEHDSAALRRMRRDRLPVEGDHEWVMIPELEPENPRRRRVDQTEPETFAAAHGEAIGHAAIDRDRVADAPRHADFHRVVEAARDRAIRLDPPVAQHPHDVAVDRYRLRLFDDEGAHQAASDLLGAVRMRVVPIGARIGHREFVSEALLRLDRRLRHIRCAVHRVRNTQAMPMDRGVLRKPVLYHNPHMPALRQSDFRAWSLPVIRPDFRLGIRRPCQRGPPGCYDEALLQRSEGRSKPERPEYHASDCPAARNKEQASRYPICKSHQSSTPPMGRAGVGEANATGRAQRSRRDPCKQGSSFTRDG